MLRSRPARARRAARATPLVLLALVCSCGAGDEPPAAATEREGGSGLASPAPPNHAALEAELDALRERNTELEAQLAWTQEQLGKLASATAGAASGVEAEAPAEAPMPAANDSFDAGRLAERGLPEHEIERLERASDAAELRLLELTHEARRDGWFDSKRYRDRRKLLDASLRRELGDEDYDWLLCATRRNNRVVVSSILGGSAAEAAGLQPGDKVLRYDDRHVFFGSELQRRVVRTEPGRSIPVEIRRGGEQLRITLPSGPIGIRMKAGRGCPNPVR